MRVTEYRVTEYKLASDRASLRAVVVADFHDGPLSPLVETIRGLQPEVIFVAGDAVHDSEHTANAFAFLRELVKIAPTFCSLGNHETRCGENIANDLAETGVKVLDNEYVKFGGFVIGGLTSGFRGKRKRRFQKTPRPKLEWLDDFCAQEGIKVLLSHHPEYYPAYLSDRPIDLILSGHAHGGQWRVFGQGIFAPGQGIFPHFTSGAYRGRQLQEGRLALLPDKPLLIVSRGLYNHTRVPRINNPEELIVLDFQKDI